jgi:hypothetical protein
VFSPLLFPQSGNPGLSGTLRRKSEYPVSN